MLKTNRQQSENGFSLIELMVVVVIIAILASVATALFMAYRQKAQIAECLASAHSIRASLISFATTNHHGSYPAQNAITSWGQLEKICNLNGSDLPDDPVQIGFQNWVSYTATDMDNDGSINDFSLDLRLAFVSQSTPGAQIHITTREILQQTY